MRKQETYYTTWQKHTECHQKIMCMTSRIMIILQKEHTHAYNIRMGLLLQGEKLQPNHLLFKSTFIKNHVHKVDPTFIKNCKIHVYKANNIQLTNKKILHIHIHWFTIIHAWFWSCDQFEPNRGQRSSK